MSRFAYKAVSIGTALALMLSLAGSVLAADPEPSAAATTQSGSNVAQVVQTGSLSSGDAVALPGAKATSGDVHVEAEVEIEQEIDQDANTGANGGSVASTVQTATNTANVGQSVTAASGDAVASGFGAQASSGDVKVEAEVEKEQEIDQDASTHAGSIVSNGAASVNSQPATIVAGIATTVQTATNTDLVLQTVAAQSGTAVADGPFAKAKTGYVKVEAEIEDEQDIDQDADAHAWGGVAAIDQTASQTANAVQTVVATSGDATAIVDFLDGEFDTFGVALGFPFFSFASAESGDVCVEAEIEQEQDVDQYARAGADGIEDDGDSLAAVFQLGSNTSIALQLVTATSGEAGAFATFEDEEVDAEASARGGLFFGTSAETGDVCLDLEIDVEQEIDQYADAYANGGIAIIDQDVDDDAANYSAAIQGASTVAPLAASSGDAFAFGEDWDWTEAESGDVGTWRCPIELEIDVEQEIEQDAWTCANIFQPRPI